MSSVYILEPPTRGKVVMNTTMGPLDIELWPKEAPKAVRNFVQLSLEGYYENTIFHRIIKSFMVQGGDPAGSGTDSIYNLLRLEDVETGENDRPLDPPPRIISIEVLWNPFDDIIPRQPQHKAIPNDVESKDQKKKAIKKLNLLSFGAEAEEEEKESAVVKEKIKSSHDVLDDPRLLKEKPQSIEESSSEAKRKKDVQASVREALSSKRDDTGVSAENRSAALPDLSDDDEASFDARMRLQILNKRKEMGEVRGLENFSRDKKNSKEKEIASPRDDSDDDLKEQNRKSKLSLKHKGIGSEARKEREAQADVDLQLLSHAERERQKQKQKKRRLQGHGEQTLAKLEKFRSSFFSAKLGTATNKPENEGNEDEDLSDWRSHKLKCMPDPSNKDAMARKDDSDMYVVEDPLLEKGKQKFNRMQAKMKRREREWAGKSIT
ncbi:hypothetical protein AMTRI_Chr05g63800 [Amborella trichopoda]